MEAAFALETDATPVETGFLIDEPTFSAELAKLDLGPDRTDAAEAARRRTLVEWANEEGIELSPPDDSYLELPPPETRQAAMTAVMFVGLMAVGAGAAAALFHDQVLRILATL